MARPNVIHYNAAIAACGRSLAWQAALALLSRLRHGSHALAAYELMSVCSGRHGQQPDVKSLMAAIFQFQQSLAPSCERYRAHL